MIKKTNIRPVARKWFDARIRLQNDRLYASKFFRADESWTKCKAWWFKLNKDDVAAVAESGGICYLLCQKEEDTQSFHCLKVPALFLHENRDKMASINMGPNKYFNIMLSACTESMFCDVYARNGINLSSYKFAVEIEK